VVGADMAQQRPYDQLASQGARYPCSSGAIVRPASLSCSQYSSAGS
jgi:hypothetical protein